MRQYHYTNGLGIVYNMYGSIGAFVDREQSSSKPRSKRFSKRKFSWAIKYLLSCVL
jgi:hypothetical protein